LAGPRLCFLFSFSEVRDAKLVYRGGVDEGWLTRTDD
jgi:hypothetical protein